MTQGQLSLRDQMRNQRENVSYVMKTAALLYSLQYERYMSNVRSGNIPLYCCWLTGIVTRLFSTCSLLGAQIYYVSIGLTPLGMKYPPTTKSSWVMRPLPGRTGKSLFPEKGYTKTYSTALYVHLLGKNSVKYNKKGR